MAIGLSELLIFLPPALLIPIISLIYHKLPIAMLLRLLMLVDLPRAVRFPIEARLYQCYSWFEANTQARYLMSSHC